MDHVFRRWIPIRMFGATLALMLVCFGAIWAAPPGGEQDTIVRPSPLLRQEVPDDPYIPMPREGRPTSPGYRFFGTDHFTVQVNTDSLGQNILGDAANEPSIAVDPGDPNRMVIGWRQFDTINSNFRQAGYAYSNDGGVTWTFPGVIEPGIFRSDPVLDSDTAGTFYYYSLSVPGGNFQCEMFRSTDGGATWDAGTFAFGGDKAWMVVDKTGGMGTGHIYAYWSQGIGACDPGFFTRSVDGGSTFENCLQIPGGPFWGTLAVGPDGELYVSGGGFPNFVVAKSGNAPDSSQTVAWDFSVNVSLGGSLQAFAGPNSPNPGGLLGQSWIAVDASGGPNHGNVYLLASVEPFASSDPLDVMFARSTDGGQTWSVPVRVNDDSSTTNWQWFGTMSVAPNGRIDVVWLDTRDNPGTFLSSLYYAYSTDGGLTWSDNQRLSDAFDPHLGWPQQNKMGDYFDMVSFEEGAHLAWANTLNGEQDVYYTFIPNPVQGVAERDPRGGVAQTPTLFQNYPNPFNPVTDLRFRISDFGFVELKIFDLLSQEVKVLVNKPLTPGEYTVQWDGTDDAGRPVASGVYLYRLAVTPLQKGGSKEVYTRKMVLLR